LTAELVTSIVLTPEMLCWYLHGLVFWIPRRWTLGGLTCRKYICYVGFSVVLCASVGYCVVCKNNTGSAGFQILCMVYIYIYIYCTVHVIKAKYNILDASKESGSKVIQKRNN
jgi:hypothetical protein